MIDRPMSLDDRNGSKQMRVARTFKLCSKFPPTLRPDPSVTQVANNHMEGGGGPIEHSRTLLGAGPIYEIHLTFYIYS